MLADVIAAPAAETYEPAGASIVVDANTGEVLQSAEADSPRHPASLTKIMTLYLLFERLEAGKISLMTNMEVSAHAASQAPSKLNLKPGETIKVEPAIRAIVTKSANDVAVVVAEALGGSEPEFAQMMTKKAREIGMTHTAYFNASGLPDDRQVTTARDMVVLGRAIQERFPVYYKYFSTRSFEFRGHAMRNHNKLLGAVTGVDGIKTGYTNASGFNLVTSVRRGAKHIVAAVFGGHTASSRDARMRGLIEKYFSFASLKRATPVVADAKSDNKNEPAAKPSAAGGPLVRTASAAPTAPVPGSTDPIKPIAVKTFLVKAAALRGPALANMPDPNQRLLPTPVVTKTTTITTVATVKSDAALPPPPPGAACSACCRRRLRLPATTSRCPQRQSASHAAATSFRSARSTTKPRPSSGSKPRAARPSTCSARPIHSPSGPVKGDKTLYRARFAGLDKEQAETACSHLRRGEIPCMLLKN